ncbi:MAG: hypothetical protein GPJ54_16170 [Candidatus Heimdallarchaeota archaeon]|nr:hypothetical protein [Candidatus Heimdallarchaeota archaeon]
MIIPINGEAQNSGPITHEVTVRNYAFSPSELQINVGDIVVFKWDDGAIGHNVAQVGSSKEANYDDGFRSGSPQNGLAEWTLSSTYTQENATLYYICEPHVFSHNMRGKIIVGAGSDESDSGGNLGVILAIFLGTGVFTFAVIIYLQKKKKSV